MHDNPCMVHGTYAAALLSTYIVQQNITWQVKMDIIPLTMQKIWVSININCN
ncbi:MAG TPA: hypothetical protein VGP55_03710 [Chitinophagaceae bacterium]|nr:hypothetical protein [Chitinophagaceae bacterium]